MSLIVVDEEVIVSTLATLERAEATIQTAEECIKVLWKEMLDWCEVLDQAERDGDVDKCVAQDLQDDTPGFQKARKLMEELGISTQ